MKRLRSLFMLSVLTLPLNAGVLYTSFGPGDSFNCCSGLGTGHGAELSNGGIILAAPFIPIVTAALDAIEIGALLIVTGDLVPDASIWLLADDSGLPGSALESYTLTGVMTVPPLIITATSASHPSLSAGTQYWVAFAPPDLINGKLAWLFNDQGRTNMFAGRIGALDSGGWAGVTWPPLPTELAFRISGTEIPEPATIVTLSVGLFLALTIRLYKQ